jgi:hypothetical protein
VHGQIGEEPLGLVLATHQPDRFGQPERGGEKLPGDQLGDHIGHSDHQASGASNRVALDRVLQLPAEAEDLIGVAKGDPPQLGEHQPAPAPAEELLSQRVLQRPNLPAEGRLGQAKLGAGLGQAALARHHPEVEQVMVVEPLHPQKVTSANTKNRD